MMNKKGKKGQCHGNGSAVQVTLNNEKPSLAGGRLFKQVNDFI